jgi:hypothetical protein
MSMVQGRIHEKKIQKIQYIIPKNATLFRKSIFEKSFVDKKL